MGDFRMPSLGADMDAGTVLEWLVEPGDPVRRGQIVAVVDTAKAAIEIESFEDGVLEEILIGPGTKVPVGTALARIGTGAGALEASAPSARQPASASRSGAGSPTQPNAPGSQPTASPPVRHLASQLGVDLGQVVGTGPRGRITHEDVVGAAESSGDTEPSGSAEPPNSSEPSGSGEPSDSGEPSGRGDDSSSGAESSEGAGAPAGAEPIGSAAPPAPPGAGRLRVTPRARRLAALRGIDLGDIVGTGASGAVLGDDLAQRGPVAPKASAVADGEPSSRQESDAPEPRRDAADSGPSTGSEAASKAAMRTAIANLMSRSNAEIPHYYVSQTMDLGPAFAWLAEHNAGAPPAGRVLPAAMFLRATVLAAQEVPDLNAHWVDGELRRRDGVDVGIAVATRGGGLVTPTLPDAADLRIDGLMAAFRDLVARARRGALRQREMEAAGITMSSVGETGPDALVGVIFPPQVALVGLGGIVQRPWAVQGMLAVRPTVTVTLAADHRASDGRTAAAFVTRFDRALQNPEEM